MENSEILANLDHYDKEIKSLWPGIYPKRIDISSSVHFGTFETDGKTTNYDSIFRHARYLIKTLRTMIAKNEKDQRIHRHYGFLQCLLLIVLECSIEDLMLDNKYGAGKWER
jgi:hypothetical protein